MKTVLFGEYLMQKGVITPEALKNALYAQIQGNELFGELARRTDNLAPEQVVEVLQMLMDGDSGKRFGELACELGFISKEKVEEILDMQKKAKQKIGEILIGDGAISQEQCDSYLDEYQDLKDGAPS